MSCRRAGGTLQCQCSLRKQRIFHSCNQASHINARSHPQKGVLNRRFKRRFAYFAAVGKVGRAAARNSPGIKAKVTIKPNRTKNKSPPPPAGGKSPRRGEGATKTLQGETANVIKIVTKTTRRASTKASTSETVCLFS